MEAGNPLLDDYVLSLVGRPRPRVCFLPAASGDADHYVVRFYRHFSPERCDPSHISLFRRERGCADDPHRQILDADIVYVGGGSVVSLLGVLRAHGLDATLGAAWENGTVMCGLSAGSLCWFTDGMSSFHGRPRAVEGLGLLPYSNAVHYDGERTRREEFHAAMRRGMRDGYAAQDGVALRFAGTDLAEVVSSRPSGLAYHVAHRAGTVSETPIAARDLGACDRSGAAVPPTPPDGPATASPAVAAVLAA